MTGGTPISGNLHTDYMNIWIVNIMNHRCTCMGISHWDMNEHQQLDFLGFLCLDKALDFGRPSLPFSKAKVFCSVSHGSQVWAANVAFWKFCCIAVKRKLHVALILWSLTPLSYQDLPSKSKNLQKQWWVWFPYVPTIILRCLNMANRPCLFCVSGPNSGIRHRTKRPGSPQKSDI